MKYLSVVFLIFLFAFSSTAQTGTKPRAIFDQSTIGEIRLTVPVKKWWNALDSMRLYGDGVLEATATVDGVKYEGVGLRFRGNNSYQLGFKRNPLEVRMPKGQDHQGYRSLKLSSALRDPSMIREALFLEIAAKYIPVSEYSFTKVYVNGEYTGIFINIEPVNATFLEKNYGSSENAFFKAGVSTPIDKPSKGCKIGILGNLEYEEKIECYYNNFENKNDSDWAELQELTRALQKDPSNISNFLDVDRTLWMLALNNVMVNLSSYIGKNSENYYLYKDDSGQFQFIPWDLNLAFGSLKNTGDGSDLSLKGLQRLDPLLHSNNPYKPLVSKLLSLPINRKIYLAHIRQILRDDFKSGWYEKRARELQGMVVVPFSQDPNKTYTLDEFQSSLNSTIGKRSKIPGIVELMSRRVRYLQNQPELTALPSSVSNVKQKERVKYAKDPLKLFTIEADADRFPKRMVIYYRANKNVPWSSMDMIEEAVKGSSTGQKHYEATLKTAEGENEVEYYIMAENAGAVSFSPKDYTLNPYKVSLSELNK